MKNNNILQAVVMVLFLAMSVLLCFQPSKIESATPQIIAEKEEKAEKEVILNYYIWENEEAYIRPVIEAYEALNAEVIINLHIVDADLYDKSLEHILSGENQADLVGVRETSHMASLAEEGYLLDVTDYISNYALEVEAYGNMFNEIEINGRYYGIPTRSTCWILLYNKEIFDKKGIPYPEQMTWEEYGELAILLTDKEGEKTWGGYLPPWCFNFTAIQKSSYLMDDNLKETENALRLLNQFYNLDKSHVSYKESATQRESLSGLFKQGHIAMMPQGEWMINMLMEKNKEGEANVRWGIAPMPVPDEEDAGTTWGQYQFACISSRTDNPEEAFRFLSFLCGEEAARIYARNGMVHAYSTEEIKKIYADTVGEDIAEIVYRAKRKQEQPAIPEYHEILDMFETCAHNYLMGNCDLAAAIEEFDILRKQVYQK
ncbi:MAG: sugar ABC transporter substrate-binding protein [Eubacteriales bacterium]|nr:sugar ABC transporter substrate-binding protein [Eubacteriales bacterium]